MKADFIAKARLASGLVIAFFLILHLLNVGLGIVSIPAMDRLGDILFTLWSIRVFTIVLYTAFAVHIGLMFVALYNRRSLRMPVWNWVQILLGLALPVLLIGHVLSTRGLYITLDIQRNYSHVIAIIWSDPERIVRHVALVAIAWLHMSMGIHYWLRYKRWYPQWLPVLYPLCLFIPILAYLGFIRTGIEDSTSESRSAAFEKVAASMRSADPAVREQVQGYGDTALEFSALLLIIVLLLRVLRGLVNNKRSGYTVTHTALNKTIQGHQGKTVLEVLRDARVQHASVCGGHGRCTTCRVRITADTDLPVPETLEANALKRINAGPDVRLACQLRPTGNLTVTPVLHPNTALPTADLPNRVAGHEQQVVCLFVDMRGSTKLGEQKMPYDVVFILNQFFDQLTEALQATDGHYATFTGDGLMALYGLEGDLELGCQNALYGALEIQRRMQTLNVWLKAELNAPLKVGIGIHCGEAIVGTMGPPDAPIVSAIGDTVNIAARLESLTKEFSTGLLVSEDVVLKAGFDSSNLEKHSVNVRGREDAVVIFSIDDPAVLEGWMDNVIHTVS